MESCVFLDRFFIIKQLGQGSYGQVYGAVDLSDGTEVAVKISRGESPIRECNILEAEILEAVQNVDSPLKNLVVKMKSSYVFDDCVVLALELASHNFKKSIDDKLMGSLDKISNYAKQMIQFLLLMSQMNVIHGDIKPENILVDEATQNLKFADFGLSHCPWATSKAEIVQTLPYRAPEVLLGYDYGTSADTWSVGCVLVECLLRKPLFYVYDELQLMQNIVKIIGMPSQLVISQAPKKHRFFWYDSESRQWVIRGSRSPAVPMGLKRYIETNHIIGSNGIDFVLFMNLVENMMRIDPFARYSPEECLKVPFITRTMPHFVHGTAFVSGESFSEDMIRLSQMANIDKSIAEKAEQHFRKIRNIKAIKRQNKRAVMSCCLYMECRRKNVPGAFKKIVNASGLNEGIIGRVCRIVKKVNSQVGQDFKRTERRK